MVTKLYLFKTKSQLLRWCKERGYSKKACEKAWTGPGYYYARGKAHISKHVPHLDRRRGGRIGRGPWRHTHDLRKAISRLRNGIKKASVKAAGRVARRIKGTRRLRQKLAKAIAARTVSRLVKAARQRWYRIPAVKQLAEEIWEWIPKRYKRGRDRVWTYIMALALAYNIYKRAREKGVDPYQYDWKELVDWSLGYREARELARQILGRTLEEIHRESLERWKRLSSKYQEEREALRELERELDEVARWELEHLDEIIGP